jgi:hypothetical protein
MLQPFFAAVVPLAVSVIPTSVWICAPIVISIMAATVVAVVQSQLKRAYCHLLLAKAAAIVFPCWKRSRQKVLVVGNGANQSRRQLLSSSSSIQYLRPHPRAIRRDALVTNPYLRPHPRAIRRDALVTNPNWRSKMTMSMNQTLMKTTTMTTMTIVMMTTVMKTSIIVKMAISTETRTSKL